MLCNAFCNWFYETRAAQIFSTSNDSTYAPYFTFCVIERHSKCALVYSGLVYMVDANNKSTCEIYNNRLIRNINSGLLITEWLSININMVLYYIYMYNKRLHEEREWRTNRNVILSVNNLSIILQNCLNFFFIHSLFLHINLIRYSNLQ